MTLNEINTIKELGICTIKQNTYQNNSTFTKLYSTADEEWYRMNLQAGRRYSINLENIGENNHFVGIYYVRNYATGYKYIFDKEKFFGRNKWYFTAKDTGAYYVKIT